MHRIQQKDVLSRNVCGKQCCCSCRILAGFEQVSKRIKRNIEKLVFLRLRLKELVEKHPLADIQTADEKAAQASPPAIEGEEAPPGSEPAKTEADMKAEYLASREALFKVSKEERNKLKRFEEPITRPYFHVKALDEAQISNWHKYLDFVEEEADLPKVRLIQRRSCLTLIRRKATGESFFDLIICCGLSACLTVRPNQKLCKLSALLLDGRHPALPVFQAQHKPLPQSISVLLFAGASAGPQII